MRLLLDTHAFIWWRSDKSQFPSDARIAIRDADIVFVSLATAWEIAIKLSIGKLQLPETVEAGLAASSFEPLPIELRHARKVAELPLHHRDPFDRMLVAQCLIEDLTLVSADRRLAPYGASTIWL